MIVQQSSPKKLESPALEEHKVCVKGPGLRTQPRRILYFALGRVGAGDRNRKRSSYSICSKTRKYLNRRFEKYRILAKYINRLQATELRATPAGTQP